ncbi:MBL fold metallo-hydrolase [Ulvibacterium sp.]|uniref:MBL fold metallo-hydrolase n=1 Tax=Ulvibacterium sp. TaxID=2665914 RepID=UPI002604E478|nr:MBL fold metallo-hydrolase [Ulvibacterium sp.]
MYIKFYGTRGSTPVCDRDYLEFGGNTTCMALFREEHEDIIIFDAGSGIRKLGMELMKKEFHPTQKIIIGFSHFHWDHIQGFPFFDPAYDPSKQIELIAFGEKLRVSDLKKVLSKQMEGTFFPIQLDNMGAKFEYNLKKIREAEFRGGRVLINSHNHPGGAHGYRLEVRDKVIVYCTDIEHGDSIDKNVVSFSKDADVLIHDAQYTPEELPKFKGWGHSSWEQAIEVAERANVKHLYLTHHDPNHDDVFLRKMEKQCQERFQNCNLAKEGEIMML